MKQRISCVSFSPRAVKWLSGTKHAQVLHRFKEALNLINDNREVLSIVVPAIGNNPFSAVVEVEGLQGLFGGEEEIVVQDSRLAIGNALVSFESAKVWNPNPEWETLNSLDKTGLIKIIEDHLQSMTAGGGFADVYYPGLHLGEETRFLVNFRKGSSLVLNGLCSGDAIMASSGAAALAGLGVGLTPSGDDFLMGAMYGLWASQPSEKAEKLVSPIFSAATGRTTALSSAWLEAAKDGEAGEKWHDLVTAVCSNQVDCINKSIEAIIETGETSGADALTGFVQVLKLE
jgi:hypothetical protein